jgi:hypothetical protein
VACIDIPVIGIARTLFFNQLVFDFPQFTQFVGHTEALDPFKQAKLFLRHQIVNITFRHDPPEYRNLLEEVALSVDIPCDAFDWQILGFVEICGNTSPLFSNVKRLIIDCELLRSSYFEDDVSRAQWLGLFHPFIAVQSLELPALRRISFGGI